MSSKVNVYQVITDRIIEELEKGVIPWQKPWVGTHGAVSHSTGRPYSFMNQLLLQRPGEYITFNQCAAEGGTIRKGEKSSVVVFWKQQVIRELNTTTGEYEEKKIPFLRYYRVWHIDQCDGIKAKYAQTPAAGATPVEAAESIVDDYLQREGVKLNYIGGDRACYIPAFDRVEMPTREQFTSTAELYSTLFHELGHSTGHKSRLNRFSTGAAAAAFGSDDYGREELVAEICAASILNQIGIETDHSFRNSASYIDNWLKAIRGDNKLIVSAAGRAEKAAALILGSNHQEGGDGQCLA